MCIYQRWNCNQSFGWQGANMSVPQHRLDPKVSVVYIPDMNRQGGQQCDKSAFTSEGWCRDFIINKSTNQSFTGWMSSWSVWWEFFVAKTVDGNDFILNACGISNIAMGDKICIDMYFVVSTVKLLKFIMSSPWVFAKLCPGHIYTWMHTPDHVI